MKYYVGIDLGTTNSAISSFDGENVWVCNSNKDYIERLSYDFIQLMVESNRGNVVDASDRLLRFCRKWL